MPFGSGTSFARPPKILGGFVPTQLSGCILWLRADLGVTGSAPVTRWQDQSTSGVAFTAAGTPALVAAAINGKPAIQLTAAGGDSFASAALGAAFNLSAFTMYAIVKPTIAIPAFAALVMKVHDAGWASGYGFANTDGAGGSFDVWSGVFTNFAATGALGSGTAAALRGEFTGANVLGFLDGVAGTTHAAAEADNADIITIGAATGGSNYTGLFAEYALYNRVLNAGELAQWASYCQGRYGFSA